MHHRVLEKSGRNRICSYPFGLFSKQFFGLYVYICDGLINLALCNSSFDNLSGIALACHGT